MSMVECINVYKEFKVGDAPLVVLSGLSLRVEKGEFTAIMGKSGSGKSTLLNLIGLIDAVTSGEVLIDAVETGSLSDARRANIRNEKVGYIFQSFHLESAYEVYKNVELPLIIGNVPAKERKIRVEECLRKVDMNDKINAYTHTLSGGEMQRVCIARALSRKPEMILADEPCGNLDSVNTRNIMQILSDLSKEGKTVIMATHSFEDAACASRIVTLKDGSIIDDERK